MPLETASDLLRALLTLPGLASPAISPDGKWVAWAWFRVAPTAEVWLAPTDGSAPPRCLTETDENTLVVSWAQDNHTLLVEHDHDGDERVVLFRLDTQTDRPVMERLTDEHPDYFLRGGELHPNLHWLIYGANYDFTTGQPMEATWVWRHDVQSGEKRVLAKPEEPCACWPELNEPGTHVVYTRNDLDPAGEQIWMVDIEGRDDREILNFGADRKVFASWTPDGRCVLFLAEMESDRKPGASSDAGGLPGPTFGSVSAAAAGGRGRFRKVGLWQGGSIRWLIDDASRNVEEAYAPWRSREAVIIEVVEATIRPFLVDLESGQETRIEVPSGNLVPLGPLENGWWLGQYASSRQPADLVRFRPDDPRPESFVSITRIWERTALTPQSLTPAEPFRWIGSDGMPLHGWLYCTKAPCQGTIVYVHGGPTAHSEDRINTQIQYFVSRGFNVLDPNYRGSTGYGLDFQESIKATFWGGLEQEDIRHGIQEMIAQGLARPGQVGMTGTSYGGYTSWFAITHWPRSVLAAAAPICGMTDLVVDYETTRPDLRPYSEEMLGGSPEEVPERYRERSPIHFVHQIEGKLLIVQGLQDPNVTPENVRAARDALERAHIPYELLTFEDEGHGIGRPANLAVLYPRLADFFEQAFR
ncbi:MAG: alpha/beta hydrolase family protein [Candidatus Xenobia bacterium]